MVFNARQHCCAFLAAALILAPAAANAQGDLIQGLFKSLKKEKTAPAVPVARTGLPDLKGIS